MLNKVDLQLFSASLRIVASELESLPAEVHISKRVFEEISCMQLVIERSQSEDHNMRWSGEITSLSSKNKLSKK